MHFLKVYVRRNETTADDEGGMILHLVAHPVDLLDVGEDHFGVDSGVSDHGVHVFGSQEVGNASVPLSSLEGDFVVLSSVFWVDF